MAGDPTEEVLAVQRMLSRERLSVDEPSASRTTFLSHLGAQPKLAPGPWIGHRELIYALALANLSPEQRTSLARAVLVEHGDEFGVGRLMLQSISSGLPFGGSSLLLRPRQNGLRCLYTWALGIAPAATECDWLLLRAQPEWALDDPPKVLQVQSLETLAALGGEVVVLVASSVAAKQIADLCAGRVDLAAHPRFAPHIEGLVPDAPVVLWPHDGLEGAGLRRRQVMAVVSVEAPERVRQSLDGWARARGSGGKAVEIAEATCPGRARRNGLVKFWKACGHPRILVRGDPKWAHAGAEWFGGLDATVEVQGEATQLDLL